MGEVFRATDEQLGRTVAVKVLRPSDRDPRAAERFHREARAAARLSDPHVVSVYDFGRLDDGFFLVMELVEGRTVGDELAQHGPLPKDRAIDIVEQAAEGLVAAHRENVVHRDVKPGNLLLATDGTVKVADFGIAHLPGDGSSTLTGTGQIIGSTHYLAPERATGGLAGKPSDVYSLGCVLYQLVTGRPPYQADHPTAILYQHVDTAPAPPSLTRPELGGPFESVLLRMLAKDAAERPSAAEIVAGALRAEPLGDRVGVAVLPADDAVDAPTTDPIIATGLLEALGPAHQTRRKALLAGGVAVLATATAVLAVVLLNNNDAKLPPTTDVGPQPSTSSSTPVSTRGTTSTASTGTTQADPRSSARESQSTSQQASPRASSPGSAATSAAPTSPSKTSASTPSPSSTPSVPTAGTPSTGTNPSTTPPPETPTTSAPVTSTPEP